ncbi:MAG TPA: aminotransferase class V-fold PLP-dependent enzyme [Terriglobales bacterium]
MKELLNDTTARALEYLASLDGRRVAPDPDRIARLQALAGALPEESSNPMSVLALLDDYGSPATVASAGGRYFGFVTGGTLPAALAANWLAGAWDQNAGLWIQSPVAAFLEEVTAGWLRDVFRLPSSCGVGFVTGATTANFSCLAAARHALLKRSGWNVEEQGLFGAPEIRVVVGNEVHASVLKALSLVGLGRNRVITVPADKQGRMRADALPPLNDRTLVCIQAGNVNSGAFDPANEICQRARESAAWVHVDGAFGLWAAAAPRREHLLNGVTEADSWATDCHKWLNVPYDSGLAFVREADHLRNAMALSGPYLQFSDQRDGTQYTPEASRRARGIEIWAALKSLGRRGLAEMIERNCRLAERFALGLRRAGYSILNDVVLNQVLVSFGEAAITRRIIAEVQSDGSCWCGGTEWQGRSAMRISVSSWATTEADVDHSLAAILRIARAAHGR